MRPGRGACFALANIIQETAIKHTSLQIIRDEHSSLAAMLKSMTMMVERGPGDNPEQFFDVLRAMLFYIDEFPERLHHPKESDLLFPRVVRASPSVMDAVQRLENDHMNGEKAVRELQHLLLAWELLGEPRKPAFKAQCASYVKFYLEHMRLEETVILPEAERVLSDADWKELDAAFEKNCDPLTGKYPPDPAYDRLFTRIVMRAPAPIGLGDG
jgi:hemerythrin-like domain-containing protein